MMPSYAVHAIDDPASDPRPPARCNAFLRKYCRSDNPNLEAAFIYEWTREAMGVHAPPAAAVMQDLARFLLVRGPFSWLGYGWEGCITEPPPVGEYDHDYGEPNGRCVESSAGIFTRQWTKAHVEMDCNTFVANITLAGHATPLV